MNQIRRHRHHAALRVGHGHGEHTHVLAVGVDGGTVGREPDGGGRAGGFDLGFGHELSVFIAFGREDAGRIFHLPFQLGIFFHRLPAEAPAVQEQFHLLAIAQRAHVHFLAFPARPVPVRQQMQHRFVRPPRLVIPGVVLAKAAHVQDAEVRIDARPAIRRRLAAVIKPRPDEAAGQPRTRVEETPPFLGRIRPRLRVVVVGAHVAARRVVRVNAARADGAALFAADVRLVGMCRVIGVHVVRADVITPAAHLDDFIDARKLVADGRVISHGPRGIEPLDQVLHRCANPFAFGSASGAELLVGQGPDGHARMIPVAADELFEPREMQRVAAQEPVFIHDQQAEPVTGFEQFWCWWIVRGAIGVDSDFLQLGDAEILQRIRQRRAHARVVLVIARAFQNVRFAVQQKSLVLVKPHGADAEFGFLQIKCPL